MQLALNLTFAPSTFPISTQTTPNKKTLTSPWKFPQTLKLNAKAKVNSTANDNPTVDYSSRTSVFPAEACETIGGESCDPNIFPEVKLKPEAESKSKSASSELVDREYLEYNSTKTVFLEEACDDLGGEFCEPDYKKE